MMMMMMMIDTIGIIGRESNYGRGLNSIRKGQSCGGPEGGKSGIKGSCGRRRAVAVKAL